VVEDVLVKVDKFIFPVNFVVMDMEEDEEVSLILDKPFFLRLLESSLMLMRESLK